MVKKTQITHKLVKHNTKYNLELLFNKVLDKSCELRSKNINNFDGQGFWQPIKKILEPLDNISASGWKKISSSKTHNIMLLPEYFINGYDNKLIIEKNHFIIQQVRIPLNEKPTPKKIIQIALNIGQYKGSNNGVNEYGFNNITQFISKNDIIELSNYITNDIMNNVNLYL